MIRKITAQTLGKNEAAFSQKSKKADIKDTKMMSIPDSVISAPAETSKAYTAFQIHKQAPVSFTGRYNEYSDIPTTYDNRPVVNMDSIIPRNFYKGNFYKQMANDIATAIGPDKGIILSTEKNAVPEMLVQDFTQELQKGKYKNLGFNPLATEVKVIDFDNYLKTDLHAGINKIANEVLSPNPDGKKVLFIKGYEKLLAMAKDVPLNIFSNDDFEKRKMDPTLKIKPIKEMTLGALLLDEKQKSKRNIHIIGLIPQDFVKIGLDEENPLAHIKPSVEETVMNMVKDDNLIINLNGTTTAQTKKLLKTDKRFANSVLRKYKANGKAMKLTTGAIDKLVDKASVGIDGAFPAKALQMIDLVAAKSAIDNRTLIDENFVDKFFAQKGYLTDSLKNDKAGFKAVENVKTRLEDVGGLHQAKEEISDIVDFLKDPAKFKLSGRPTPKGALFVGPPGTGKTLMASGIAGSTGTPFLSMSGSDFVNVYVGKGAANVRDAFNKIRELAKASGKNAGVLFIDEIDAVGKKRSNGANSNDERENTLNAILTEMDGLSSKSSDVNIVVLAATNREDTLDNALTRPGRFDASVHFNPPANLAETKEILNAHMKKLQFADDKAKTEFMEDAASRMEGRSGAQIGKFTSEIQKVIYERTKKLEKAPKEANNVTPNDVAEAYMRTLEGRINTDLEFSLAQKETVVIHEAGHALVQNFIRPEGLDIVSNQSRGHAGGITFTKPLKTLLDLNFKSVIEDLAMGHAGGISEKLLNPYQSEGWNCDLEQNTQNINFAIKKCGLGVFSPKLDLEKEEMQKLYAPEIKKDISLFEKTESFISEKIVDFHKDFLTGPYMEAFRKEEKSCLGGNALSGKTFDSMVKKWVKDNHKEGELARLHEQIDKSIKMASEGNLSFLQPEQFEKLAKKAAKNIAETPKVNAFGAFKKFAKTVAQNVAMHLL